MIRFIDLRGQDTGYEFAFFDTATDTFVSMGGVQVFESVEGLVLDAGLGPATDSTFLQRLIGLIPDWVPKVDPVGPDD